MDKNYSENVVPVVYASDDKYAPYMYISIKSLISHTNQDTYYQIYVLYTNLTAKNKKSLRQLAQDNVKITCIDVQEYLKNLKLKGSGHLSVATCYRLFIAELFKKHSKIVYMDSDTVILDDIEKFYAIDLKGKTVGAVHDVVCTFLVEHYRESIDMDVKDGFNAGILLIDTKKFAEKKIKEECIRLLEEDSQKKIRKFFYMDQDVLNLTLRGDIFFIDNSWNFQWQYLWRLHTIPDQYRQEYVKCAEHPRIMHYAGDKKPWERPDLEMADIFWETARDTACYEEILFANLGD